MLDCCGSPDDAGLEVELLVEPVDGFRSPMNDTESRVLLRGVATVAAVDCRGARDVDDGEPRTCRDVFVTLGVAPSSLAMTPNSFIEIGDGLTDPTAAAFMLVLRLPGKVEVDLPSGGVPTAEVRLEIRGIFVGVSFGNPETEFRRADW